MADLATEGSRTAPIDGSALEPIVRYAAMAPSSHNTQPWRFEVSDARIDVLADRSRALPVGDPDDRELTISCGCAVFNLRVAAAHAGFASTTHILPDPDDPDRLARVTLEPCATSLPEAELFSAIERRHTYRRIFERRPVSPPLRFELIEAAQAEGAWLAILQTDEAREGIATLVAQGDVAQWADASWRRELATWMHPRARGDGLAVPAIAAPVAHVVVRRLDLGRRMGAKDEALAIDSPLLAVLGTTHDDPVDWVQAGQALERVLLTACAHGLQASYLNQPIQVPSLRARLAGIIGQPGAPQVLLRLGFPTSPVRPAPRRPVADVIERG